MKAWNGLPGPGTASRILLVLLLCCIPGCRPAARDSLLVILVDTERADHSGLYGYPDGTTPVLDRLGRRGLQFPHATAPSPWTNPSVASLFTGLYPSTLRHAGPEVEPRWFFHWKFDDQALTLAEHLGEHGYRTAAFIANPFTSANRGFAQGFEAYHGDMGHVPADVLTRMTLDWIESETPREEPVFLYVHYYDPHSPYRPPEPWGRLLSRAEDNASPLIPHEELQAKPAIALPGLERIGQYRSRYDGEIRFADHHIARLVRAAESCLPGRGTYILVCSDHGEGFLDHGRIGHRNGLHAEEVRVPLVLCGPRIPHGHLMPGRAQLPDLFPTLCHLLDLPVPPGLQGQNLLPPTAESASPAPAYMETNTRRVERAVELDGWKLIRDHVGDRLYNLVRDPGERVDRRAERPDRARELGALLDGWLIRQRSERLPIQSLETEAMDEERVRILQSLGYTGS